MSVINRACLPLPQRTVKLLEKRGLIVRDQGGDDKFLDLKDTEAIDHLHSSSITYQIALGKHKGQKALTLGVISNFKAQKEKEKPFLSRYSGFSLHGGISCKPHDRKKLEHICRYISRPSLSEERLSVNFQGQVVYKLKTAYRNGTTHIILDPLDFLSRLASLIPRPRLHLTRFHGVFAPHFRYRSLVIPAFSDKTDRTSQTEQKKQKKSYSIGWAKILKRVFDIDIQTCLKCGGQIKVITAIQNPQALKRILTHFGENSKVPELAPPRGPPEAEESLVGI